MCIQRCRDYWRSRDAWSHTHLGEDSTKDVCFKFYGIFEREKQFDDFERFANLKYKFGNRHFWCRGYYVDTVGKNAKKIQEYIQNQLKEDWEYDQMSLKEYIDPFTGEPVKSNR